jgi:regulator of protease activity HflC (stomatin/prohibitin superfamily)
MAALVISITVLLIGAGVIFGGVKFIQKRLRRVVPEDQVGVTVNKDGFVQRVLPSGRYFLRPSERIDFLVETKTKLAGSAAEAVITSDGIAVKLHWSGTYALRPELITENRSQRLRGLANAERAIARNVRFCCGSWWAITPSAICFSRHPQQLEQQVNQSLGERLKPLGIAFNGLNLQTIDLPARCPRRSTKPEPSKTLDQAIRHIDPTHPRGGARGVPSGRGVALGSIPAGAFPADHAEVTAIVTQKR